MGTRGGVAAGLAAALLIACAAAPAGRPTSASGAAMPGMADAGAPAGSPRGEIDRLDHAIEAELGKLGLPAPAPPACAASGCMDAASAAPVAMGTQPVTSDPTCKPAASDTCTSTCGFADSICENAGKICSIARDLGGHDAYANGKCASGTQSCEAARGRCCACQL